MKNNPEIEIIGKSKHLNNHQIRDIIETIYLIIGKNYDQPLIEIHFTNTEIMGKYNEKYLGRSGATDVLSFPVNSNTAKAPRKILGSIIICEEYSDNNDGDTSELIKHGMLHLLGYDHEKSPLKWESAQSKLSN